MIFIKTTNYERNRRIKRRYSELSIRRQRGIEKYGEVAELADVRKTVMECNGTPR